MATILALEYLYDAVVAQFAADNTSITNVFGWREPSRQLGANTRIVWTPGDSGGNAGDILPPRNPGRNPRPIATLDELVIVRIQGCDNSAPDNERLQYHATRVAYDLWYRAVYLAAYGTFEIVSTRWIVDHNERRFGAALEVTLAVQAAIVDAVETDAAAALDLTGSFPTTEDNVTEIVTAP